MNPLGVVGCPDPSGEASCQNGEFEKAEYIGAGAARAVLLAPVLERCPDPELSLRRLGVFLPVNNLLFAGAFQFGTVRRRLFGPDREPLDPSKLDLSDIESGAHVQTEVNRLRIGPLDLLLIPAAATGSRRRHRGAKGGWRGPTRAQSRTSRSARRESKRARS